MRSGISWRPTRVERVNNVLGTSTRPLHVVTDAGNALVKYMGNRAGSDALVTELLAAELAVAIGLRTPEFAVHSIPAIETTDPMVTVHAGPAFFSKWEVAQSLAPNSKLLANLRRPSDVALLVAFDTWIRNKDRFARDQDGETLNYDNVLLVPDKKKTQLLVIDHSHAFAETTLEDELDENWATEQAIYGLFNEFAPMLTRGDVMSALDAISRVALSDIRDICHSPPPEWGFTAASANRLSGLLAQRAELMRGWFRSALFAQAELDLDRKED
jgi:hypothetical protein